MKKFFMTSLLAIALATFSAVAGPVDYVSTLVGTQSKYALSTGNTYPAIALPWGMNFWTPQTGKMGDGWTYTYDADKICGFKQTHQPSPWMNDYGQFSIMPVTGGMAFGDTERASWFSHKTEVATPYYYAVHLADHDVKAEITPTSRAAMMRFSYAATDQAYLVIDAYDRGSYVKVLPDQKTLVGYSTRNSGGVPRNFRCWFVLQFDQPILSAAAVEDGKILMTQQEVTADRAGAIVRFDMQKGGQLQVKVASSFISLEQAQQNLKELGDRSFEEVVEAGREEWNQAMGCIQVKDDNIDNLRTFYSCLYRAMLFPRSFYEITPEGKTVHYSPYNGKVEDGYMFTDTGFWDTFRSLFPLLNLVFPSMNQKMQEGLVNAYNESGFLPEWASPGHRDCMIGNHSASIVADAYIKGLRGYDIDKLWEALEHGTHSQLKGTASGRVGYEVYNKLGYVPCNVGITQNVARTLEYTYNDWTIYALGKKLGKPDSELEVYRQRALNYKHIYNPKFKLMCGRDDKGNFRTDFNPTDWSRDFTEGNSWHWSFCVFHDPAGLMELMGGKKEFTHMLDSVFVIPSKDGMKSRSMIHEMREMHVMGMGQYAHGNQPIQHMVYLYNYAGEPWKAQYHVRNIMDKLYTANPDGYCGDEDNGQTSAWYVFSALGFYPVCPGTDEYVLGTPLFKEVTLTLENGKTVNIKAPANGKTNYYVKDLKVNGKPYSRTYFTHDQLLKGAKIEYVMSAEPNTTRSTADADTPYSLSK